MSELKLVEYDREKHGDYKLPEGAEELLSGKAVDEQVKLFSAYVTSSMMSCGYYPLDKASDVKGLLVKDGTVVGIMVSDEYSVVRPCYVGESICTWDSSDNNGAGYKSRVDYIELVFTPENK